MADQTNLALHLRKDVRLCHALFIGITSSLAAFFGAVSAILIAQLSYYRKEPEIGAHWVAGLLFVSPGITGLILAYKQRVLALSSHIGVSAVSFVLGCFSTYYSVMVIYQTSCKPYPSVGECHKYSLMIICLTTLIGSACLCGLSTVFTIFAFRKVYKMNEELKLSKSTGEEEPKTQKNKVRNLSSGQENIAMDIKLPDQTSVQKEEETVSHL
ncbi:uncharacterized protein LOC106872137 isoform X2 [Octopus bimaculoides]|uniref:Uncharacterized protein n=1 Tax=Octopus bimaculoides TaxID=37653 RepID=A0A0L8H8P0_OCTBM|nr:uncharacterized protein LOC106872137 isoform X2 [Octopus bimaculoides]|eukprot:XP_014774495.1 PREDICTED: uncharacterized protein LOC106872137 [Octopus bimaculoides]